MTYSQFLVRAALAPHAREPQVPYRARRKRPVNRRFSGGERKGGAR